MRVQLVVSAVAATMQLVHGLHYYPRSLATYPTCTTAQTNTFFDNLSAASDGCTATLSYDWGGRFDPTEVENAELCKCTVSSFDVPKCIWIKGKYGVPTKEHFEFAYNCTNTSGFPIPSVIEVELASYTPTPTTVKPTSSPTPTPTPTTAASTPTPTPTSADNGKLPCTEQQLNTFSSALYTASNGCMGGSSSSYSWGGINNPLPGQLKAICKCTASEFDIPQCSIVKGSDTVQLSVHYNWVMTEQCLAMTPSSTSNMGLIAGIAGGGVVLVVLLVVVVVLCRRRKAKDKEEQHQSHIGTDVTRSPVGYSATGLQTVRTNSNRQRSGFSGVSHSGNTISDSSGRPKDPVWRVSKPDTPPPKTAAWEDPVIMAVRIPFDSIFFGALLSRGGFGEVYRGMYRGETVALKQLLPARRKDLAQINDFLGEVKLVSTLDHERIVKFIGVAWNSLSDVAMVVEFMENGDLRSVLTRWGSGVEKRSTGFDADKIKIALHVAHALVYLHSLQPVVVHRDLKSKNILLDANMDAKLTDFGVSREHADSTMTAGVGSSLWMAPEVMMGNRYDEKADIFSFGVVLSELDTHQLPYFHAKVSESGQKVPEAAILQQVMLGRITVGFTDRADRELVQLGRECVSLDPKDRPTTAMVLHRVHQVMQGWHRGIAI